MISLHLSKRSKSTHQETKYRGKSYKSFRYLQNTKYKCDSTILISKFRQKSAEASIFGEEIYSKKWMQQIKIELPMHRNQKLGKLVFEKLKRLVPHIRYKPALKCFKDQGKILRILLSMKPRQDTIRITDRKRGSTNPIPEFIITKNKPKPSLKLFPFNKSVVILKPLFETKRIKRNISQDNMNQKISQNNDSPERSANKKQGSCQKRLSLQIKNIYGIKPFSHF